MLETRVPLDECHRRLEQAYRFYPDAEAASKRWGKLCETLGGDHPDTIAAGEAYNDALLVGLRMLAEARPEPLPG
jgi:hypothetical protein